MEAETEDKTCDNRTEVEHCLFLLNDKVEKEFTNDRCKNAGEYHEQSTDAVNDRTCDNRREKCDNHVKHQTGGIVLRFNMRGG